MFIELEALVRRSPLLISISAEGEYLRLSVTPTPADSKAKQAITPVSLVGTAAELDEGLAAALLTWQGPKKTLQEQAQAAADGSDDAAKASPPAAAKPAAAKPTPGKPGPKPKDKAARGLPPPGGDGDAAPGGDGATTSATAGAVGAAPAPGGDAASSTAAGADGVAPAPGDGTASSAPADAGGDAAPGDADAANSAETGLVDVTINEPPPGATLGPADDVFTLELF
ncbi:PRTRC system protein E [Duganella sp. CT11-25]|uniref:PRTRC system protein E n=1 Tax=unclassified Duganella TaxID=2636909 RepID=UPI0039AF9EFD